LNSGTGATSSTFWRGDGVWSSPAGGGDVVGPASSTDNAFTRFDSTTGKLLQNSTGATLSDTGAAVFTGALDVLGNSTAGSNIKLYEDTDNGTNYVSFKAPDTIAANVTWTLPSADGTNTQVLQTNGSGVLSFVSAGGASAATPTALGTVYGVTASTNIAVALGYQAATTTVSAGGVTAIGYQALTANTGASNTAVGSSALQANTSATFNTAIGAQAGYSNQAGTYNTFVGYQAGYSNNVAGTGAGCFIGQATGYSTTGAKNTFVGGNAAGYYVTSGASNTILGNFQGNSDGLDIRTASNYAVIADGDGNRLLTTANGQTLALDGGAVPNSGTGITFPATQVASSDANTLDDYEEGTWTPSYSGSTTGFTSVTYGNREAYYIKIGKMVQFSVRISTTAATIGSASGNLIITGLPFTEGSTTINAVSVALARSFSSDNPFFAQINANTTTINLQYKTAIGGNATTMDTSMFSTGADNNEICISGSYRTTA